jgi:hypothetical protein
MHTLKVHFNSDYHNTEFIEQVLIDKQVTADDKRDLSELLRVNREYLEKEYIEILRFIVVFLKARGYTVYSNYIDEIYI